MLYKTHWRFKRDVEFLNTIISGEETWVYGYNLKSLVITVEASILAKAQKGVAGVEENQSHVVALSILSICLCNVVCPKR